MVPRVVRVCPRDSSGSRGADGPCGPLPGGSDDDANHGGPVFDARLPPETACESRGEMSRIEGTEKPRCSNGRMVAPPVRRPGTLRQRSRGEPRETKGRRRQRSRRFSTSKLRGPALPSFAFSEESIWRRERKELNSVAAN